MTSLVTVQVFDHPVEAHIANGLLKAASIPSHLQNIHLATASWPLSNAIGGIQLQVPAPFAEAATELLMQEQVADNTDGGCAKCGSARASRDKSGWKWSLFSFHVLGIPWPWSSRKIVCESCGEKWLERDDV